MNWCRVGNLRGCNLGKPIRGVGFLDREKWFSLGVIRIGLTLDVVQRSISPIKKSLKPDRRNPFHGGKSIRAYSSR